MSLDTHPEAMELPTLQTLLDEVTLLRQESFCVFSAHEVSDDRAFHCFFDMCHDLSNKINAKISRQRQVLHFKALRETIHEHSMETPGKNEIETETE